MPKSKPPSRAYRALFETVASYTGEVPFDTVWDGAKGRKSARKLLDAAMATNYPYVDHPELESYAVPVLLDLCVEHDTNPEQVANIGRFIGDLFVTLAEVRQEESRGILRDAHHFAADG